MLSYSHIIRAVLLCIRRSNSSHMNWKHEILNKGSLILKSAESLAPLASEEKAPMAPSLASLEAAGCSAPLKIRPCIAIMVKEVIILEQAMG